MLYKFIFISDKLLQFETTATHIRCWSKIIPKFRTF